jgi:hypothetical protein
MKRAKLMLTAIAVFAVVGGALAFKANRVPNPNLFRYNGTDCVAPTTITYSNTTTNLSQLGFTTTYYATATHAGACPLTTLYTIL